jgi:hypothetical protein
VPLEISDNLDEGLQGGSLVVTADDLRAIFDPVINRILMMIQLQVDKIEHLRTSERIPILLVGGFGSSQYLRKRVEEKFLNCRVGQPPDA